MFRVAAAYVVGAWLLVQVIATIGPAFDLPNWVLRAVVLAAIVGFLATMAFMLFRARTAGKGRHPIYLSQRARLVAGALIIAAAAGTLSIRSLTAPCWPAASDRSPTNSRWATAPRTTRPASSR